MSHLNSSVHETPFVSSFSSSDSFYPEHHRTILPQQFTILLSASDSPANDFQNAFRAAQRSASVVYDSHLHQQTQAFRSFSRNEQLSEASDQMHGSSDSCASPSSSSVDSQQPPPLDVSGGGRWQLSPYYPSHAASQIPSESSDLGSPLSMHSLASSLPQYQSLASPTYPTEHSPFLGAANTVAAANTDYQESMSIIYAYLNHTMPNSLGTALVPYGPVPTAPLPVVYDLIPKTPEPTAKKRKRVTPQQLKVLNRVYARNAYPPTIERQQLARDLDMTARRVQVWFQNRRQKDRVRRLSRANSPINVTLYPDTSTVIAHFCDSPALSTP